MRMLVTVAAACSVLVLPAQITVDPMPLATLCGSPTVSVSFTAAGNYNAGNVFTAELSDATGSFAAPTIIGMLTSTTSGNISCDFPAGMSGGFALRINASDPVEVGTPYVLPLVTVAPPDAGLNAVLTVCSNDPPLNLFTALNGTPQAAGAWTSPAGAVVTGVFDPAADQSGCYSYTVAGTPPCANAAAVVCITVVQAPNAGADTTLYLCSNAAPFLVVDQLAGTPSPGGTWTNLGAPFSGVFIPGTSSPGCYVYTVPGSAPCAASNALACVYVDQMGNAGTGAYVSICSNDPAFSLFAELGGSPDPGGPWSGPSATVGGMYDPATMTPGVYTYSVGSAGPCPYDTAAVVVFESPMANAGLDGSSTVCATNPSVALFSGLGGTPQPGGTWLDPNTVPMSGIFVAGSSAPGCYRYIVTAMAPCMNDTAEVCVTLSLAPDAGTGASVNWCQSFGDIDLFAQLTGTPQAGGTWVDLNATGALSGSIFSAAGFAPGSYAFTYAVSSPGCAPASSTVTVNVGPCLAPPGGIYPVE